jgi:hypothetical protein
MTAHSLWSRGCLGLWRRAGWVELQADASTARDTNTNINNVVPGVDFFDHFGSSAVYSLWTECMDCKKNIKHKLMYSACVKTEDPSGLRRLS